ncbi:MAG TPA: ABC transporter permease, partial [Clostridia bacterium]|nr:ABC transporter permease [Clostridia bacterium]
MLIGIFVLWEVAARQGWIDAFITSSPSRVLKTIISLYKSKSLFVHIWVTFYETVVGFLLGTFLGTSIAIMLWWSPTANKVLDPYLVVLNAL